MKLNLETLKQEIVEYMEAGGFIVFRGTPSDGESTVSWDTDGHPDYRLFLDVARKLDAKPIIVFSREFEEDEVDGLLEQLEESGLPRDERHAVEQRIRNFRPYIGATCYLELAFNYEEHLYSYTVQAEWMDELMELELELDGDLAESDEGDAPPLGGYFSKN